MSVYFQGWGPYFLGWGSSSPTPTPSISGGGGGGGSPSYLRRRMPQDVDEWFRAYSELRKMPAAKQAAKIVKPFAETKARVPTAEVVDWEAFSRDAEAAQRLFALWIFEMDLLDDDDDVVMLEH